MIIQGTETLTSILHIISESLLTPVVVLLVVFVVLVILFLGGFINEAISRKSIKRDELEGIIRNISSANSPETIKNTVEDSSLFPNQKKILIKIADNYDIGPEARKTLATKLIEDEESKLIKNTSKTDILIRLGPILGLLGTLIPLGPGLSALGSGDIATLAESLTIAFDTTVVGLSVGAVAYLISKFKKQWYESDLMTVETIAEAELENLNK